ncbi:OmpL47-type beta-barrel domain-containing protein [Nocardioides iriomotensis]|uniref:Ig-like domain-containing protein n=1 Tax=Nocardioides iriomotensis TaxID=715784 RepID=A0A4V1Z146_9ACTN|nr:PxKF domain-containing protein [Nocardioides iriomotensis]RYU09636.1 hypothetical protein ETU37_21640 [Nocardioides iriomotensis]
MSSRTSNVPRYRGLPRTTRRRALAAAASALLALGALPSGSAFGLAITNAVFSGGTGTASFAGTLYATPGASVTLTVQTDSDARCVKLGGAFDAVQVSDVAKTTWSFPLTAQSTNGVATTTVAVSDKFNNNQGNGNNCTGNGNLTTTASYVVDGTGPVVTAGLSPAANAAGWYKTDVTVRWTATDTGSGVAGAQPFRTDTVSAEGISTITAPGQTDRLGNTGAAGSVTVRVDKTNPTITAAQTKHADGTTTVTFTCSDPDPAGGVASGIVSCLAAGSTTNSKTVGPSVTVNGTATDRAGNTVTTSSTTPVGDTTPPSLSGTPTTSPNGNGWYRGDVTIDWTAADPESGVVTAPANTMISSEGTGLTSSQTVTNGVGLSTTASSSPSVNIDRTAPTTGLTGTSNDWVDDEVTVGFDATDILSGVDTTTYTVDGGSPQTGNSVTLSTDGTHTLTYFSTDKAGNAEAVKTAEVKIDRAAPTIGHTFSPSTYTDGAWTNGNVTVTFSCEDQGDSGLKSCTAPVTVSEEGAGQQVHGAAEDNAGNTATDLATVSIDKTDPTITAQADRVANDAGWYDDDVTVSYTASDSLSGISGTPGNDVLGEGQGQSAGASVADAAGNSASAGVTGINVDKTDPELTASYSTDWHTGDVTVDWSCSDALSGVATGPVDDTVTGEGDNLSSSASCTDEAGNSVTETVQGIRIDRHAPVTTGSLDGTLANGWYRSTVEVTLSPSDNLSDVDTTYYELDGGATRTYDGPFSVTSEGSHTVEFWSEDVAGNVETAPTPLTFHIDTTAPTTTVTSPLSTAGDWHVESGIAFAFGATDARSGVAATYFTIDGGEQQTYGAPFTEDLSDGTHSVTYWSVDAAGNVEVERSFDLFVDTVDPTISATQTPAKNAFGWNNTDVEVSFSCDDATPGSGVASCTDKVLLVNETAGEMVNGSAVDRAGRQASTLYGPVRIDTTKPTLQGVLPDANAAGWYRDDVVVTWVGDDALSKLDPATQPGDSTITGEGSNLGAGPVTISDKAGNESEETSVSGVNIDRTAPVIAGGPTTAPNAAGWYNGEVVVDFTCTDVLSGVATCPTSRVLRGNGAGQSVTSDPASDVAGNVATGKTVGGISIDGTAPVTAADNLCTKVNGWCTGSTANVVLTAQDQAGLAGVKEIHYSVNDGAEQVVAGSSTTAVVPLNGSGQGTVDYWAVDNAGNRERLNSAELQWDNIAPTVTHSVSPAPNAEGWNRSNATVTFDATDDDNGSGVDASTVTAPVVVSAETAGQLVAGSAKDLAGNVGADSATVKLDKTTGSISGAITSGTKGDNGWYTGPVKVEFTCDDALSGVAACAAPVVLTANGASNFASGTMTDVAGNTADTSVAGIKIDQEKPTLTTAGVNVQGGTYTVGQVPAATCTATDSYSGVASCTVTVTGGNANGVGEYAYSATAKDQAGNATTITGTYKVIYRFDGFLQPINDTAHQVGTLTSIFKAGSTVPVKFQLKKADGTVVQATSAPKWLTPVKGSAMTAPVDETAYAITGDSGSTYRWDASAQQYIYNWKTDSKGGNYWRIGVTFDDGQTYYVNIGLR